MNYTPLIEWAIATGRLKDGLPRACWVQEVVKDERAAVAKLLETKATKRHSLQPPAPWRDSGAEAATEYPVHLLSEREREAIAARQGGKPRAVAASADSGYPAQWLSRSDHDRIAKARERRG